MDSQKTFAERHVIMAFDQEELELISQIMWHAVEYKDLPNWTDEEYKMYRNIKNHIINRYYCKFTENIKLLWLTEEGDGPHVEENEDEDVEDMPSGEVVSNYKK